MQAAAEEIRAEGVGSEKGEVAADLEKEEEVRAAEAVAAEAVVMVR